MVFLIPFVLITVTMCLDPTSQRGNEMNLEGIRLCNKIDFYLTFWRRKIGTVWLVCLIWWIVSSMVSIPISFQSHYLQLTRDTCLLETFTCLLYPASKSVAWKFTQCKILKCRSHHVLLFWIQITCCFISGTTKEKELNQENPVTRLGFCNLLTAISRLPALRANIYRHNLFPMF